MLQKVIKEFVSISNAMPELGWQYVTFLLINDCLGVWDCSQCTHKDDRKVGPKHALVFLDGAAATKEGHDDDDDADDNQDDGSCRVHSDGHAENRCTEKITPEGLRIFSIEFVIRKWHWKTFMTLSAF